MKNRHILIKKIAISIMLLALGYVLPFITAQVREIGNMLNLIHIPTMLAGVILGPVYGALIGFITPITRSLIFGMPKLYPLAICMSIEMMTYGLIIGLFMNFFLKKLKIDSVIKVVISLLVAIILGRITWGITRAIFALFTTEAMTFKIFITSGFVVSWPGILLQIVFIPLIYIGIKKTNLLNDIIG